MLSNHTLSEPALSDPHTHATSKVATWVTLKIASLEYRSKFLQVEGERNIGFELGADVSTTIDIDEYYVYDRNPKKITEQYADMLLRHISSELPEGYLKEAHGVMNGNSLMSRLFTEKSTFSELARSCEGVVRDLINIFTIAYFDAHRRERSSIDRVSIVSAARQWFEQDKASSLDEHHQTVLERIVNNVIGNRSAKSFLLPRQLEKHLVVQKLFDLRVLHLLRRGYADKDNPGTRYNIYTLDYGTYVDLIGTKKQPQLNLYDEAPEGEDVIVPFDDNRSIRRIILTEGVLE